MTLRKRLGIYVLVSGWLGAVALHRAAQLPEDPVVVLSLAASAVEVVILALAVGTALLLPGPVRARLGLVPSRLTPRRALLLAVGTLGLSHALDSALVWSGLYPESQLSSFARTLEGARGVSLLVVALAVGVLAPLAEELLCRGLVQRSAAARLGPLPALAISAAVFGALHVEPIHAFAAALLGLYLGAAGWLAGSVWVPIGCHVANNLFALGGAAWNGPTDTGTPLHVAAGLAVAAGALVLVRRPAQRRLQPAAGSVDG